MNKVFTYTETALCYSIPYKTTIMEYTMYKKLLQLPLFQGMGESELTSILEKMKLNFCTYQSNEVIASQNAPCLQLIFILSGKVQSTSINETQHYIIEEFIDSPAVIEPYSLYGMRTQFNATYTAIGTVQVLCIDKPFILSYLNKFEIFQLNYFNMLSNRAQTIYHRLQDKYQNTIEGKILQFLYLRCVHLQGEKILHIKMVNLAEIVDETRLNVSKALNNLQEKGLLELGRKTITILSMPAFINQYSD